MLNEISLVRLWDACKRIITKCGAQLQTALLTKQKQTFSEALQAAEPGQTGLRLSQASFSVPASRFRMDIHLGFDQDRERE